MILCVFFFQAEDGIRVRDVTGSDVCSSDLLLQKLEASLVLGNTQQFHSALFVGRESGNFSNQITDKLVVLGLFALVVGGLLPQLVGGGL